MSERDVSAETHSGFCELFANGFLIGFMIIYFTLPLLGNAKLIDFVHKSNNIRKFNPKSHDIQSIIAENKYRRGNVYRENPL